MGCVVQAEETGSNVHKMVAHWPCWCVYWQTCGVHVTQPPQNGCPKWEAETFTSQRLLHTTETCSKFSTIQMQFENVECVEHTMDHPLQSMEEECPSHWQALEVCLIDPTSAASRSVPSDNYCGADQGAAPLMTGHRGQHKVGRWQWTVAQVVHACCVHSKQSSGGIRSGDTV